VVILAAQPYGKTLRCHECGVTVSFLGWRKALRYADAVTYTEKAVAHSHHGVYYGTVVDLDIAGLCEGRRIEISYAIKYSDQDPELENLRSHVSRFIAARLQSQLAEEQSVPWTAGLTFLADELEFRPISLLNQPPPDLIPYDEIEQADFNNGNLRLYTPGVRDGKPRLTMPTSTPNFYAGFVLLHSLCPHVGG
jgi:hypothetical protein